MPESVGAFGTKLWITLERSTGFEAEAVRSALRIIMPRVERVLSSAATAPTDFTLHDHEHSWRVAQKMAEVVPAPVLDKLQPYELALLILSAYLHDIGMTPDQRRITSHWRALIATPQSLDAPLTPAEHGRFQAWLDDYAEDIQIPLCTAAPTEEQLRLADKLVTHYARARHNDWSEEWIRANLGAQPLGSYEGWIDDVVTLCRSHHEGYDELRGVRCDPRPAGSAGVVVHLRYLACVLRVADVLEIDPERTPDVVFAHREIASGSILYWRKDHASWLKRNGPALVLTARPARAAIEKAIRDTGAGIEAELQVVARLNREQPFNHCAFAGPLPHAWDWPEAVELQVQPSGDGYVYIDGAFRPNTHKLLQLLSGTQLYRHPLVAVRELVQNAFDAVKEEIAVQRLRNTNLNGEQIAQQHRVELRLEQRDGRHWLICTDSGVGMTQAIIRDYLLVSGASRRHEIVDLERRCRAAGFSLGRTGEFGIGVLSYFMIADRFEVRTRRTQSYGGLSEATGWYFETDGVGSFGELRRDAACTQGSEVRLRLRRSEVHDAVAWFNALRKFLREVLCVVPCAFELTSPLAGCENMTVGRGWVRSSDDVTATMLAQLQPMSRSAYGEPDVPLDRLPRAEQERLTREQAHYAQLRNEVAAALRWETKAGELPDGLGTYRVHVPLFELPGGRSAVFMRISGNSNDVTAERVGKGLLFYPSFEPRFSWHGMVTRVGGDGRLTGARWGARYQDKRYFVEIDLSDRKAGQVTVDRRSLSASPDAERAMSWAQKQAVALEGTVLESSPSSYEAVNFNVCNGVSHAQTTSPWAVTYERGKPVKWKSVTLPAICSTVFRYQSIPVGRLKLGRKTVSVVPALGRHNEDDHHYGGIQWPGQYWAPDRVVAVGDWRPTAARLWEKPRAFEARENRWPHACQFPPEWKHICCCLLDDGVVWNASHPLVVKADEPSRRWWGEAASGDPDPLDFRDALLGDASRGAAWMWHLVAGDRPTQWQNIVERDPDFVRDVWRVVVGETGKKNPGLAREVIAVWEPVATQGRMRVFRPDGYSRIGVDAFDDMVPKPAASWLVRVPERALGTRRVSRHHRRRQQ